MGSAAIVQDEQDVAQVRYAVESAELAGGCAAVHGRPPEKGRHALPGRGKLAGSAAIAGAIVEAAERD